MDGSTIVTNHRLPHLPTGSYLYVITRREHCGDFLHQSRPIYKCTGVLAIPLVKDSANKVLTDESQRAQKLTSATADGRPSSSSSSSGESEDEDDVDDIVAEENATPSLLRRSSYFSNIGEQRSATLKPSEAQKWQRNGAPQRSASEHFDPSSITTSPPAVAEHSTVGQDAPVALPESLDVSTSPGQSEDGQSLAEQEANKAELEDKLVKEAARQFARGEMFFAYEFDITTSLQRKYEEVVQSGGPSANASTPLASQVPFEEPRSNLPLWRRVDRKFFHNEFMSKDFINAGLHTMVLPLMQGYFQSSPLEVQFDDEDPEKEGTSAQLLIVSRRSRERPGLRYQRRGINEAGQVANYVETEQILLVKRAAQTHLFSFVQFRGSIPLFWSQSPFSMKPPPVLERSPQENADACSKHFQVQTERYGNVTCINLAEQAGKEGEITDAYRRAVEDLESKSNPNVHYQAFDFHKECAGMKFENVSKLIDLQKDRLEEMNCFWRAWGLDSKEASAASPPKLMSQQRGIFRVSCLDCLDRTNVVQSAFGRHTLQAQFARIGITPQHHPTFDFAFNDMWANNGDQVSQCYAGSRALKGDFTRTGKRNLFGMMNDATASVYRMVQGAVTDFWRQTVISFMYGELSLARLERFTDDLQTADPSNETRLARIRAVAIETCASMVLQQDEDSGEHKIGGWALFSPLELSQVRSAKLEEKVVILSNKALYICAYDFTAEKFCEFTRVGLGDVRGIQKGPYVISPKDGYHPEQHWGLLVRYTNPSTRLNTASIRNVVPSFTEGEEDVAGKEFVALKAIADEFAGTLERDSHESASGGVKSSDKKRGKGNGSRSETLRSQASLFTLTPDGLTSHQIVDRIVGILVEECATAGACDADGGSGFVEAKSIQR